MIGGSGLVYRPKRIITKKDGGLHAVRHKLIACVCSTMNRRNLIPSFVLIIIFLFQQRFNTISMANDINQLMLYNSIEQEQRDQYRAEINSTNILWSKNWIRFMNCTGIIPDNYAVQTEYKGTAKVFNHYFSKCATPFIYINSGSPQTLNRLQGPNLEKFTKMALDNVQINFTLITADGDLPFPTSLSPSILNKLIQHPKLTRWYTQNYDGSVHHPKLFPIPIGLDLHTQYHEILNDTRWDPHSPQNNIQTMLRMRSAAIKNFPPHIRPTQIYIPAMEIAKRHPDRKLLHHLLDQPDCINTTPHIHAQTGQVPITTTWESFGKYRYGVSPFGNGLDCHRTWEMLWMGMIPIVRSSSLDRLYQNLPVIILKNSYTELCEAGYLEGAYEKIRPFWPAPDRIFTREYWLNERYEQ